MNIIQKLDMYLDEACPGDKIKSKGKGKGLGKGKGKAHSEYQTRKIIILKGNNKWT